jgi:hypothetical protein
MTFAKSGTKPALESSGWLLVLLSRLVKNAFRSWEERMQDLVRNPGIASPATNIGVPAV